MDLFKGPGIHVVEQRRDEALRRLSTVLGLEDPEDAGAGESGSERMERSPDVKQGDSRRIRRRNDIRSASEDRFEPTGSRLRADG